MNFLILIIVFLYVYDIKFIAFPLSIPKIIVLFLFLIYGIKESHKLFRILKNKKIFLIIFFYLFVIHYSLILPIFLKTYDFAFFKTISISFIEVFLGSFFIVNLIVKKVKLNPYEIISTISFIQAIIVLLFYVFPEIRNYIFDNYILLKLNHNFNLHNKWFNRGIGLTGGGAVFSIVQLIGAYSSMLKLKEKSKYKLFLIFQLSSIVLLGRTGIICYVLINVLLFLFGIFDSKIRSTFIKNVKYLFEGIMSFSIFYIIFLKDIPSVKRLMNHSFELFINLVTKHSFETQSTNILIEDMLFLPTKLSTYLIGDGRTSDAILGNYMGTDSGYLRTIFFGGIFFFIIYYSLKFMIIKVIFSYSLKRKEKIWILILGMILFLCELKGPMFKNFTLNKMLFILFWFKIFELEKYRGVINARKNNR